MNEQQGKKSANGRTAFSRQVGTKEKRLLRARRGKSRSIWLGLGMLGLVGWAVAIPTLFGIAIGVWIDRSFPSQYSWTLMLMLIGLVLGCLNAWRWIANEYREIRKEHKTNDDESP